MNPAAAYIRVSTRKQGKSGLGLEAQEVALARFAEAEGYAFARVFEEVESPRTTTLSSAVRDWPQ